MKNKTDLLQEAEVANADEDLNADASKLMKMMTTCTFQWKKSIRLLNIKTLKVDVENISKITKTKYGDRYMKLFMLHF